MDNHPSGIGIQQNPNPYGHHLYHNSHYSSVHFPQTQNPHPNPDPNYSANSVEVSLAYAYPQTAVVGSGSTATPAYYPDPNAAAIIPFGLNPYAPAVTIPSTVEQKLVTANSNSISWTNQSIGSQRGSTWKKGPKKIKVVQSAWCEICRVDCNSKNVLDQHKLGKKHKKNLEKLIAPITSVHASASVSAPIPPLASTVSDNPVIGPQENPDKAKPAISQKARKRAVDVEDLETKRKKILDGGAAVDAVRTCAICNVVCNSETVFRYHLAGQKHIAMMKKNACAAGVAAAT